MVLSELNPSIIISLLLLILVKTATVRMRTRASPVFQGPRVPINVEIKLETVPGHQSVKTLSCHIFPMLACTIFVLISSCTTGLSFFEIPSITGFCVWLTDA